MAPKIRRMSYREIYGLPEAKPRARARSSATEPCLPFGYQITGRSKTRVRNRCVLLSLLLVPLAGWKLAGTYGLRAEDGPSDASGGHARQPRRLGPYNGTWADGMMHGYDCLSADDYQDKKEVKLTMVRKYHVTMGGPDGKGCKSGEGPCLRKDKEWAIFFYLPGMFYMFIALAIVCDEFFVPSLEKFVEHYEITPDIAGATFMAAGGSMPELFTSLIAVFDESDVGFAAIVGSAVFNVLFVIAVCALASKEVLKLTAWPLGRDCSFYLVGLSLVVVFFSGISPAEIEWWEALILFFWYIAYCSFMKFNERVNTWVYQKLGIKVEDKEEGKDDASLRKYSNFRGGIVKILTKHQFITDTAGIAVVTQMNGSLEKNFKEMDTDQDGHINQYEFTVFMQKLGWKPSTDDEDSDPDQHYKKLWRMMRRTEKDMLSFENFSKWYKVSEARVAIEVRRVFDELDVNGNGTIDKSEIQALVGSLRHGRQIDDIEYQDIVKDIAKWSAGDQGSAGVEPEENFSVDYPVFERWYSQSMYGEAHKKIHQTEAMEEEGFSIDWPDEEATKMQYFWYFFTYPLCSAMYCSLPDVRRKGYDGKVHWAVIEFLLSLVWIAVFSICLYECTVVCSNTVGIPPPVAAVTILAGGTSVPDLLSSYIVARRGEGDMAVSSSIGSNIFDITVGLPIPWMLYSMVFNGKPVKVNSKSLGFSVIVLIAMLAMVIGTVMIMKWRMTKALGGVMFVLYIIFLVQDLLQQLPEGDPVFSVNF